jgi:uncharacterized membrane protein
MAGKSMRRFRHFVTTTIIGGFAVILPIVIFIWVVRLIIRLIHAVIAPLTGLINLEVSPIFLDLLAVIGMILICFLLGLFVRTRFGHGIYYYIEKQWFEKLPVYASIRDIVQQFTGQKKTPFTQVVLIEVLGSTMTGFVTDDEDDSDDVTVFVPTAPNPTNGFVFHTTKDKLTYLHVKTEDALRTVVGMGAGSIALIQKGKTGDSRQNRS